MDIECPLCHQNNAIQKITGIVSSGTKSGGVGGIGIGLGDSDMGLMIGGTTYSSSLAKLLSPPKKPSRNSSFYNLVGLIAIPLPFVAISLLLSTMYDFYQIEKPLSFFWSFIFLLVVPLFLSIMIFKRIRNKITEETSIKSELWREQISIWNRLYYCHRDDILFDPRTGQFFSPHEILNYINRNVYITS